MNTAGWDKETLDSVILGGVLRRCTIDDCAGILITGKIGKEAVDRPEILLRDWLDRRVVLAR